MLFGKQSSAITGRCSSQDALFGGSIHHHDFICALIQKATRDGAGSPLAGDAFHVVLMFLKILQVHGSDDRDAGIEQLLDVLPAMGIGTAWRVLISKTVNQRNLGVPTNYRRHIDRFRASRFQKGNDFKLLQYGPDFRRIFGLQRAYYNVLTSFATPATLVQHLERFAYSASIAEENLQPAAPLATLLSFDFGEQLLRGRSLG